MRADCNVLKNINHTNGLSRTDSIKKLLQNNIYLRNEEKIEEKQFRLHTTLGKDDMEDLDLFLILLLKNLTQDERFILLNKLIKLDWENSDDNLQSQLQELIDKKTTDEDLKKTLDYESFLWDISNWKNFFLNKQK